MNKQKISSLFPMTKEEKEIDRKNGIKRNPMLGVAIVTVGTIIFWSMLIFFMLGCEKQDPLCKKGDYTYGVMCPEIYEPVCAPDGTTYANSCYAEKDGWDNSCIILGECN